MSYFKSECYMVVSARRVNTVLASNRISISASVLFLLFDALCAATSSLVRQTRQLIRQTLRGLQESTSVVAHSSLSSNISSFHTVSTENMAVFSRVHIRAHVSSPFPFHFSSLITLRTHIPLLPSKQHKSNAHPLSAYYNR